MRSRPPPRPGPGVAGGPGPGRWDRRRHRHCRLGLSEPQRSVCWMRLPHARCERGPCAPGTALAGPGVSARSGGVPAPHPVPSGPPSCAGRGHSPKARRHPGKTKGRSRVPSTGSGPTATAPPPLPSPRLPAVRTGPAWSHPPSVLGVRGSDVWGAGCSRLPPCPSCRPSLPGHKHPFRTYCVLGCLWALGTQTPGCCPLGDTRGHGATSHVITRDREPGGG